MILIYVTCNDIEEAKKISRKLLDERLVACTNIFPMNSMYRWKGKLIDDKEVVLIIKTVKKNFSKVKEKIKEMHSYEVPCIFSIKVDDVDPKYLKWLEGQL